MLAAHFQADSTGTDPAGQRAAGGPLLNSGRSSCRTISGWQMSVADQPVRPAVDDIDLKVVPAALGGPADVHSEWLRPMYPKVLAVPPPFCDIAQFSRVQVDSGRRIVGRRFELKGYYLRRLPAIVFDTVLWARGPLYELGEFRGLRPVDEIELAASIGEFCRIPFCAKSTASTLLPHPTVLRCAPCDKILLRRCRASQRRA
jgi:hypothetical protein